MIITIAGKITHKGEDYVVVEAGGIGHQVFMHALALKEVHLGTDVLFWIHEHIREDTRDLYGFPEENVHALFRKLLSISGVGPSMALNILCLGNANKIEKIIDAGDIMKLSSVSGVGKKTAQKIILELKGKLVDEDGSVPEDDEVVSALTNLGYSRERARDISSRIPADTGKGVEERLRVALREAGR